MKDYIEERVLNIAQYVLKTKCTVREAGKIFCVSKSTAHKDLGERLFQLDKQLHAQVSEILNNNWNERYIRGGMATQKKSQCKKNNN